MTVLVTADWHLNDKPRDRYRHEFQPRLRQLIDKHKVEVLVMLGDLTDEKDNHGAVLVNEIAHYLRELRFAVERIFILQGNHDCIDPAHAFFQFATLIPNLDWINRPDQLHIKGLGSCLFLPHTRDYKRDWEKISFQHVDLVFTHNTFRGAQSSSNRELDGIPIDVFPRDLTVISGDVHVPQDVGNVTYVGAPYTIDFGDTYKPRVLLLEDGRMRSIPCPGPQKLLIEARDVEEARRRLTARTGDIVKVRINWTMARIDEWLAAKRGLLDWAAEKAINLHGVEPVVDTPQVRKRYKVSGKARTDLDIFLDYCKHNDINQVLTKVGKTLIEEDGR